MSNFKDVALETIKPRVTKDEKIFSKNKLVQKFCCNYPTNE